jgi:hypothetical protein
LLDGYFPVHAQDFAPETGDQAEGFYALSLCDAACSELRIGNRVRIEGDGSVRTIR